MIPALTLAAKHWRETALGLLLVLTWALAKDNKSLRATIAARPQVETHVEKSSASKTTTGPVKTTERFAPAAGKCVPVLIERITEAAPVVVEKIVEITKDKSERPACEVARVPRWLVGASADPFHAQDGQMIRGGASVAGRLDLFGGHSTKGNRSEVGVMVHF